MYVYERGECEFMKVEFVGIDNRNLAVYTIISEKFMNVIFVYTFIMLRSFLSESMTLRTDDRSYPFITKSLSFYGIVLNSWKINAL